ncbi:enoyl-CoA hydratase [Cellulosimicrobium aquatile]|uniref:3-hydroxyisobutyryl-CoA hydrolase n=2 Tax=Cellulosimicrobium TaxID=157920 RepID=A0A1N6NJV8_9MICO|nr:enoyl-CoA hydratase/isomerase family protein [Cellulosimicrobium funkei]NMF27737.1 enoyl-CoA hydratase/isomerase family protein [Cellulosimicrobium aquatile]SIP92399.1 enoyl-CoA hydratase [Cellulosimicrobium aquatile]
MTSEILARVDDGVGHLTLDRPRALNALGYSMLGEIADVLDEWRVDPTVRLVLLDGAGDRGLCAGGDIRELHASVVAGRQADARRYFRREYAVDAALAELPVPVVTIMDGITMGGGVGLAAHAPVRVVTERSRVAMPETRIGFTPDVGGSWLLARAPGRLGEMLALGAVTMDAADAIHAGFADHYVPSERLPVLGADLAALASAGVDPLDVEAVRDVVRRHALPAPVSGLVARRAAIDAAYAADTVPEIVARLRAAAADGDERAGAEADELERLSPTAVTVALAAVRSARDLPDLRAALAQEYGLVCWFVDTQPDLVEGIRAQVVDKDRDPSWRPATLAEVDPALGAEALAYVPAEALWDDALGPRLARRAVEAVVRRFSEGDPTPDELAAAHDDLVVELVERHEDGSVVVHLADTCGEHFLDGYWPAVRLDAVGDVVEVTVES